MNINNKTIIGLLVLILVFSATGCTPYQRPEPEKFGTRYYIGDRDYANNTEGEQLRGHGTTYIEENGTNMDRYSTNLLGQYNRRKLERAVEGLVEVRDAAVIKNNVKCYVAIDLNPGTTVENTAALRTEIGSILRRIDNDIKQVYVTTDEDSFNKLRGYTREVDLGKSINNFINSIEKMFQ